jgi:hypothetical protein
VVVAVAVVQQHAVVVVQTHISVQSVQQAAAVVLLLLAQVSTAVQAVVVQTLQVQPQKEQALQDKDLMAAAAALCSVRLVPAVDQAVQAVQPQAVQ